MTPEETVQYGSTYIGNRHLDEIPIQFKDSEVNGNFHVYSNLIRNLANSPKRVTQDFNCSNNDHLVSLKGSPQHVGVHFDCSHTKIKSLHCDTVSVGKTFNVVDTPITSLEGAPGQIRTLVIGNNKNLRSLKDVHKHLLICNHIVISTAGCDIESNILGLLLVYELKVINMEWIGPTRFQKALDIINGYIRTDRVGMDHILACQLDLIDAGLEQYAEL